MPPCVVCGGEPHAPLPVIGPPSMASDLRLIDAPLRKEACEGCGLVRTAHGQRALSFEERYALYAHAPGQQDAERTRQARYAEWVASMAAGAPEAILDVGCGNGSLLLALRERWPGARLYGCDPSRDSVRHGLAAGLNLWPADVAGLPDDVRADLIITINVIEHTPDPLSFLEQLRARITTGGRAIVICPDGARPDVELLIADHVHSFTAPQLELLLARAGWTPRLGARAPSALGAFQAVVGDAAALDSRPSVPAFDGTLHHRRRRFFERWAALDEALMARAGDGPLTCFGMGEAAGLLRAYAPRTWRRVHACTADVGVAGDVSHGLPVVPLGDLPPGSGLLLGVRPQDQPVLAARLGRRFDRVVAWYDLVEL
jgi:SAM-dependent methyltransferase